MANHSLYGLLSVISQTTKIQKRPLFYWLVVVFNRVDEDRVKEVGPDRACAEWLLKNGASVRWKGFSEHLKDYNSLPDEQTKSYIEAVDATDSAICHNGFPHFVGCRFINEVKLVNCKYIDDRAIPLLSILRESLTDLEITNCKGVTEEGLRSLKKLKNLKTLKISELIYVKDKDLIKNELTEALRNCKIDY